MLALLAHVPLALVLLAAAPADAQHRTRLRVGLSGVGGGFVGMTQGALGGLSPRVGIQLDDTFAVYLQGQGLVGQFIGSPSREVAGVALHALMFDLTLGHLVQLGAGPSLDFVWGCSESNQRGCTGAGPYLGGNLRVAVLAGYRRPSGRAGPIFSFDVHPTWLGEDLIVTMLFGIGYEVS